MTAVDLVDLVHGAYILLDFDGPVCAVYTGGADRIVAEQPRDLLAAHDVEIDGPAASSSDPLAVLRLPATAWWGSRRVRAEIAMVETPDGYGGSS